MSNVEVEAFKQAMSWFASGVTVVTTRVDGELCGMTASSFTGLSLDPPLVLVCISSWSRTHAALKSSGVFAVSILSVGQADWGKRFAGLMGPVERFDGVRYLIAETGSPILPGSLSWVDCRVYRIYDGGDHSIFVGEVLAVAAPGNGRPLIYYDRTWSEADGVAVYESRLSRK